jgi:hypothetical protein
MRTIPSGAKGSFSLVITPEHLANRFKDAMLLRFWRHPS